MTNLKRIKTDTRAEDVMYPFILIICIILILGFVLAGLARYAESGAMSQGNYPGTTNPFRMYNYTTISAEAGDDRYIEFEAGALQGYEVTASDVLDHVPYPTDADPFVFTDDEGDVKYVHVIRNNSDYDPDSTEIWEMYLDFFAIRRHTDAFFWDPQWQDAAIPFSSVVQNFDNSTNVSITNFRLGNSQDSLFINVTYGGESNFTTGLWANDFNLFYGWSLFRLDELDFWNAISMVLYQDIPGVHPIVNWLIHGFVIATIVFVVFTMATRMTPFLGGD